MRRRLEPSRQVSCAGGGEERRRAISRSAAAPYRLPFMTGCMTPPSRSPSLAERRSRYGLALGPHRAFESPGPQSRGSTGNRHGTERGPAVLERRVHVSQRRRNPSQRAAGIHPGQRAEGGGQSQRDSIRQPDPRRYPGSLHRHRAAGITRPSGRPLEPRHPRARHSPAPGCR
jgi:hypothetical protein